MAEIAHLLNRQFKWGEQDCFALLRDFYKDSYDIEIMNFARPEDHNSPILAELFKKGAEAEGFQQVEVRPNELVEGDVLLMAINSRTINHCAVYLGNGNILHHYVNSHSKEELLRNGWRRFICAYFRHPEVKGKVQLDEGAIDLIDYYPEPMRSRLRAARDQKGNTD